MGRRGPPPKPTKLKLLHGNPGKRKLNEHEPAPKIEAPTPPEWMSPRAKEEWARVMPELLRLGLMSHLDRAALAGYCQSYANFRDATLKLRRFGMTFTTEKGYVGLRPEVSIAQRERHLMRQFAQEFGFTPSARSRVSTATGTGDQRGAKEKRFFGA